MKQLERISGQRVRTRRIDFTRWIFVAPAMAVVICLLIYPLCSTVLYSFTNKTMIRDTFKIVGLKNYLDILADESFYKAFLNTLRWTVGSVLGQVIVGFTGAICLNQVRNSLARSTFRILCIIPWAFPAIATAMVWKWILNGIYGFLPTMLVDLGITEQML